ncbi:MAG: hypothetical protein Q7R95_05080 [bacterium]|nr:hypothetical protein [bacterium]
MKYLDLQQSIHSNIFTLTDVAKHFAHDPSHQIQTQLSRFVKRKLLTKIKRNIYVFDVEKIDELYLAHLLYSPSYISLEYALHYYGIIPDIPQQITSITTITTKKIISQNITFSYSKIQTPLYWGYHQIQSLKSESFFPIAEKEKAFLDYLYIRKINTLDDLRIDIKKFDINKLRTYIKHFPLWVQKIKI